MVEDSEQSVTVRTASLLERFGGVLILAAIVVWCVVTLPETFPTDANIISVLNNQAVTLILTLGVIMVLSAGVFDISIGGMMSLSVMITTSVFEQTQGEASVVLVIALALGVGLVGGLINAFLVVGLAVDPFIATLGTGSVFLGISSLISGGGITSEGIPAAFTDLGQTKFLGVPLPIWYALALALVVWYVLSQTPLGRFIYATGQGREPAALSGVPTNRLLTLAFVVSALLAALAGVIFAARIGAGQPNVGGSYLLPAYAAAFLGSTIFTPGRFNVPGTIVAILIIGIGVNGLQLHGISSWVNDVFQGGALILAVVISRFERKRRVT